MRQDEMFICILNRIASNQFVLYSGRVFEIFDWPFTVALSCHIGLKIF